VLNPLPGLLDRVVGSSSLREVLSRRADCFANGLHEIGGPYGDRRISMCDLSRTHSPNADEHGNPCAEFSRDAQAAACPEAAYLSGLREQLRGHRRSTILDVRDAAFADGRALEVLLPIAFAPRDERWDLTVDG
jgi:hypothetical protein